MSNIDLFHRFDDKDQNRERPQQFTFPFCYEPHPLSLIATDALQNRLTASSLIEQHYLNQEEPCGKMFGILVVENQQGELGYLAAFSGKLAGTNHYPGFVPPVYDILHHENVFVEESLAINQINHALNDLMECGEKSKLESRLDTEQTQAKLEITAQQETMAKNRQMRKKARKEIDPHIPEADRAALLESLAKQSIEEKRVLSNLKDQWKKKIEKTESQLSAILTQIEALKEERKQRSHQLQHDLFSNYCFLNAKQEKAILIDLFKNAINPIPPAGSGECAAPKLLHYAYENQFKPIAMAEFWWGHSPKSAIRQHKKFYPACQSKCLPILTHMLQGLDVEENPLLTAPSIDKDIEILFQDEAIVVLNKPSEMLSVPGVHIMDSAFTRLKQRLGEREEGPFVLHRLDQSTSGLLVFALTKRANRHLQKQFISRGVSKRYIAHIEGCLSSSQGDIHLPLAPDLNDRPRQIVCSENGKAAETHWETIDVQQGKTRLYLYPKTGRTHQLRVHCAHKEGLNAPIIGDDLYGTKSDRLHLHAESLYFVHPYTQEPVSFTVEPDF
ncbi:pseudouridine synthase [Vibrio sp.]|nr:pseudouridine synthase [Vibrio sp.]